MTETEIVAKRRAAIRAEIDAKAREVSRLLDELSVALFADFWNDLSETDPALYGAAKAADFVMDGEFYDQHPGAANDLCRAQFELERLSFWPNQCTDGDGSAA
jgi:hypothetical protein